MDLEDISTDGDNKAKGRCILGGINCEVSMRLDELELKPRHTNKQTLQAIRSEFEGTDLGDNYC